LKDLDKKFVIQAIRNNNLDTKSQLADIELRILNLQERQDKLLDLQLD